MAFVHGECRANKATDTFLRKVLRVKRSALPKVVDAAGRTPLVIASELGCSSSLPDLVRVGYDINARDGRNLTALWSASSLGALDVVTELLHFGRIPRSHVWKWKRSR
jgi:ankyrin repeat protein